MADLVVLQNPRFLVEIAPYGAALHSFQVLVGAKWRNIVLTRPDPDADVDGFLGASIGRYANRIAGAKFVLDGQEFHIAVNEPPNVLHGGPGGFHAVTWDLAEHTSTTAVFTHTSPAGDQGFPGEVRAQIRYELFDDGLSATFTATTDAPTVLSLTNHAYFNLAGAGTNAGHLLQINASAFTPVDAAGIPTGVIRPVAGTPWDFRQPRLLGEARAQAADPDWRGNYDHNFCVDGAGLREQVVLRVDDLELTVSSDAPGVQIYDGGYFTGEYETADGRPVVQYAALAIEPQQYPDAPNQAAFPSPAVRPGETYRHTILWTIKNR
ncbi:MAG: galactose mutarotase [Propionibacteriaceae bacterium]|jgi:aldose 1-epimerase|nr:galactose mutarotase [Propionibacteriaceae bacterium]